MLPLGSDGRRSPACRGPATALPACAPDEGREEHTVNDPAGLQPQSASVRLADWSLAHQDQLATAMRLIAAGGRSNDACLHARQFLEQALTAAGMQTLTSADYRHAAVLLYGDRRSLALGDVMDALAGTDGELRGAVPAWHARYAARPETQPERQAAAQLRTGEVKESGQASRGLDGAWYTRAWYPRSGKPAVVVTSSALSEEIVNFANTGDARSWLESRSPAMTGPLRTTATGPTTRTAREEELLAFILRDPQAGMSVAALAGPATWTTHLRTELFAAWQWATAEGGAPGYGVIAAAYTRRLLRARSTRLRTSAGPVPPARPPTSSGWPPLWLPMPRPAPPPRRWPKPTALPEHPAPRPAPLLCRAPRRTARSAEKKGTCCSRRLRWPLAAGPLCRAFSPARTGAPPTYPADDSPALQPGQLAASCEYTPDG
jgi:hypothetical protein